jgi:hypothetical protein
VQELVQVLVKLWVDWMVVDGYLVWMLLLSMLGLLLESD